MKNCNSEAGDMKAARKRLNEIVDGMLSEGMSVARIAAITGVSARTIHSRKADRLATETDSVMAELEAELHALLYPDLAPVLEAAAPAPAPAAPDSAAAKIAIMDACPGGILPVPSVAGLVSGGMAQEEAEFANRTWTERPEVWAKWSKDIRRDWEREARKDALKG